MDWLLNILISAWGFIGSWLSHKTLFVPTVAFIAALPVAIHWIKKILAIAQVPALAALTQGWGPRVLNGLLSFVLILVSSVGPDNPLTALEGVEAFAAFFVALGINFAGAEGVYKLLKKILGNKI